MLRFVRDVYGVGCIACLATLALHLVGCTSRQSSAKSVASGSGKVSASSSLRSGAEEFGAAPPTDVEPVDVFVAYNLPKLRDSMSNPLGQSVARVPVVSRARDMNLISRSGIRAWQASTSVAALSREPAPVQQSETEFNGQTASALNQLISKSSISAVRVTSKSISVDQPIMISRSAIRLDLGTAILQPSSNLHYLIRVENANDVRLFGGILPLGDSGLLISGARNVRVSGMAAHNLTGPGVVVTHSSAVVIRKAHLFGLKGAGIILHGRVTDSLIEENRIENGTGGSDSSAAILLTDREVDIAKDPSAILAPGSDHFIEQPINIRRHLPAGNLIRNNELIHNQASGVYSDGGATNTFLSNLIAGNAKVGICLDNASIANVVASNIVRRNGQRWGESDAVLQKDLIADWGRLDDGTPVSKEPGITLDNALYNLVFNNNVVENYGGGIRLARTGLFNLIGLNTVRDNALGGSDYRHFFGIELGLAQIDSTPHSSQSVPARGNLIFSNLVRGPHYSGIFFGDGSDENTVFDNVVMDCSRWALEASRPMPNFTVNNLTNLPSRNIGAGLDPNLFVLGRAVMDTESDAR